MVVARFRAQEAAALGGPAWLLQRRRAAAERAEALGVPSPAEEIWRYSRIDELDLARFAAATTAPPPQVAGPVALTPLVELADAEDLLGALLVPDSDFFTEVNTAFAPEPFVLRIPAGVAVAEPIVVTHRAGRSGEATFPRLIVDAGADSEVTIVEWFVSDDVEALVVPVTEIEVGQAARVRYLAINDLGPQVWQIGSLVSRGQRDSTTLLSMAALGGSYARVRSDSRLVGQGASAEQVALYFGEGNQMHDFRTLQDHAAPRTTSNLLFKGAVEGHARSVYSGLIKVRKEAPGTNAFQTNRNIKLSEGAWAESVPNLDIETNDVRCSHASAVGPIDEDQRFYLESRGVPPAIADRLIVLGFFDEVLDRLPVRAIAERLRASLADKLDRRDG